MWLPAASGMVHRSFIKKNEGGDGPCSSCCAVSFRKKLLFSDIFPLKGERRAADKPGANKPMVTVHSAELTAQLDRYCNRDFNSQTARYKEEDIEQNVRGLKLFSKNALYEASALLPHMKSLRSFTANISGYEDNVPEKTFEDVSLSFPDGTEKIMIYGSTALRSLSLHECRNLRSLSVSSCPRLDQISLPESAEKIHRIDLYGITPQYSHHLLPDVNTLLDQTMEKTVSSKIDISAFLDAPDNEIKRFFRFAEKNSRVCPVESCSEIAYALSKKDLMEAVKQIKNIVDRLCTRDMTPPEKLIMLSEYCKKQFEYGEMRESSCHTAAGAVLTGYAVCEGQGKAMTLMAHRAGICVRDLLCTVQDPLVPQRLGVINAVSEEPKHVEQGRIPYKNIPVAVYPDEYYFNREATATHQMNYYELDDGTRCYFDVTNDAPITGRGNEEMSFSFYTKKGLEEMEQKSTLRGYKEGHAALQHRFYREEFTKEEAFICFDDQKKILASAQEKFEKVHGHIPDFRKIKFPKRRAIEAWIPGTDIRRSHGRDPMEDMRDTVDYHTYGRVRGMYPGKGTTVNREQGILMIHKSGLRELLLARERGEFAVHSRDGAVILCGDGENDMMINDGKNSCRLSEIKRVIVAGTNKNIYLPFENEARVVTRSEHDAMREEVLEKAFPALQEDMER